MVVARHVVLWVSLVACSLDSCVVISVLAGVIDKSCIWLWLLACRPIRYRLGVYIGERLWTLGLLHQVKGSHDYSKQVLLHPLVGSAECELGARCCAVVCLRLEGCFAPFLASSPPPFQVLALACLGGSLIGHAAGTAGGHRHGWRPTGAGLALPPGGLTPWGAGGRSSPLSPSLCLPAPLPPPLPCRGGPLLSFGLRAPAGVAHETLVAATRRLL